MNKIATRYVFNLSSGVFLKVFQGNFYIYDVKCKVVFHLGV